MRAKAQADPKRNSDPQMDPNADSHPPHARDGSDAALTPTPPSPPSPPAPPAPTANSLRRQRVGMATALWMSLAIGGIAILGTLAAWHLARRGRLIRERLDPPKPIRWPDLAPGPESKPTAKTVTAPGQESAEPPHPGGAGGSPNP